MLNQGLELASILTKDRTIFLGKYMIKHLLKVFLIFIISFEMCLASTLSSTSSYPLYVSPKEKVGQLIAEMQSYRDAINGKEECVEDETDKRDERDINSDNQVEENSSTSPDPRSKEEILADIFKSKEEAYAQNVINERENACSLTSRKIVDEEDTKKCEIQNGFIFEISKRFKHELDEKEGELSRLKNSDPMIKNYIQMYKEALHFKKSVEQYVTDDDYNKDEKRHLILNYISLILWPFRELQVVFINHVKINALKKMSYQNLLPTFPDYLFPLDDSGFVSQIEAGPKGAEDPFHLKLVDGENGWHTVRFDSANAVSRDILILMRNPTIRNYLIASKWLTIQMMMTQYSVYTAMAGDNKMINQEVRNACNNRENGGFDDFIKFEVYDEKTNAVISGENFIENILQNHGLVLSEPYLQFYHENIDKDPLYEGYSGLVPFESYKFAQVYLKKKMLSKQLEPSIDDFSGYEDVIKLRLMKVLQAFDGEVFDRKSNTYKKFEYRGKEMVSKILYPPSENESFSYLDKNGKVVEIDYFKNNLSSYLSEKMQQEKVHDLREIISSKVKALLEKNQVKLPFPSLYTSSVWRDFAIKKLFETLVVNQSDHQNSSIILKMMDKTCKENSALKGHYDETQMVDICHGYSFQNEKSMLTPVDQKLYQEFLTTIIKLIRSDEYIPGSRVYEEQFEYAWMILGGLWNSLRDKTDLLDGTILSEYDFILKQVQAGNPWARSRLSYLIYMDELNSEIKKNKKYFVDFNQKGFSGNCQNPDQCYLANLRMKKILFEKAGKTLGLNQVLVPQMANHILRDDEKRFYWNEVVKKINSKNVQLFGVKLEDELIQANPLYTKTTVAPKGELLVSKLLRWGREALSDLSGQGKSDREQTYYNLMEEISYKNLFTKEDAQRLIDEKFDGSMDERFKEEFNNVAGSELERQSSSLLDLFKHKGNPEAQAQIYEEFLKSNPDMLNSPATTKDIFLTMDSAIKSPLYKELIIRSAQKRRNEIEQTLSTFCEFKPDDHQKMQTVFYSTMEAQNNLNQILGQSDVHKKVIDKMRSMSEGEWTDMKLSFGMMGLIIGSVAFGSLCTATTAGACAPLSLAMVASSVAGYGIQAGLFVREKDRYFHGKDYAEMISQMENLGMTDKESSDNLRRSPLWMGLEASGLIAFLGPMIRSTYLSSRFLQLSASSKHLSSEQFQALAKSVMREADTKFALDVLEYKTYGKKLGVDKYKASVSEKVESLKQKFTAFKEQKISYAELMKQSNMVIKEIALLPKHMGKALKKEFFGEISVNLSKTNLDKRTAYVISRYWNDDPSALLHHIRSYIEGSVLRKDLASIEKTIEQGSYKNFYLKWKFDTLLENKEGLLKLEELMENALREGKELEKVLYENIDLVTHVFSKLPIRKREFLHMMLFQGGPHLQGNLGRRIPFFSEMADGLMMRKYANARNRLLLEDLSRKSREILGQSLAVVSDVARESVMAMDRSIKELKMTKARNMANRKIDFLYKKFQDDVVMKAMFQLKSPNLQKKINKIMKNYSVNVRRDIQSALSSSEKLKKYLFSSHQLTIEEQNFTTTLWDILPVKDIFKLDSSKKLTHEMVSELSHYETLNDFEKYLNALRIQLFNKNDLLLDYM